MFCLVIIFRRKNTAKDTEIIYGLLFVSAVLFAISQAIAYFVIFEPIRISSFAIIIATALLGLVFYRIFENTKTANQRKLTVLCMILVICSSSVFGVLNVYESPWKGSPNKQMTLMDVNGLDWFLGYSNYSIPVMNQFNPIRKYKLYESTFDNNSADVVTEIKLIPAHFGYYENETMYTTIGHNNRYMITSELIRKSYLAAPKNRRLLIPRYLDDDFKKLGGDPTVNKLYLNGEFEVWSIVSNS